MLGKKHILFIVFLIASTSWLCALPVHRNNNKEKVKADTTSYKLTKEKALTYSDSDCFIPAYPIYRQWNTVNIHPYHFKVASLKDSVKIVLAKDSCHKYFVPPIVGVVTSDFGQRSYEFHYGIDIDLHTGDSVRAAFTGKIRYAHRCGGYGNVVVIRHNNGLETFYAHLSRILVKVDQDVHAGDVIALGGSTGRSTGSHLHFEVRYRGLPINPHRIISFKDFKLKSDSIELTKRDFHYLIAAKRAHYYRIRKGDTLYGIALRYHTTVSYLCRINHISRHHILRIGHSILI